ncbi:MAG: copper resistance protein CopC/CopD [Acidimicrobiia bacterium]|nr:copper resistance protein CopC/CopD [Acidimicrobiia bacterium]
MMLRRGLAVLVLAGGVLVAGASPAFAHAELVESDPAPGAVLAKSPAAIALNFTETVQVENGGVRLFDADGDRVDQGAVEVSGSTVRAPVPKLDDGSYVVTWRALSGDSHPIQGAFTFQVGEGVGPGATSREVTGLADRLLGEQGGDKIVGAMYGIVRGLVFAGLALLIGGAVFAAAISPRARRSRRARAIVGVGWVVTLVASIVGLLIYGPYVSGLGLGEMFSTSLLGDTVGERFGQIWLVRIVVLLVAVPLLAVLFRRSDADADADADAEPARLPAWWLPVGAVAAIVLAATPGLAGHAVSGDWVRVAVVADTLHVLAMAVWLGGIVVLAAVTLRSRATIDQLRESVPRFSRVALGCIAVLAATGAFQTWRQVGSLDALRSTDYGRILMVKLVLFAAIVVFAAFSREVVLRLFGEPAPSSPKMPAVTGGSDDDPVVPATASAVATNGYESDDASEILYLRRSVWAEIVLAVAVLAATALLVNAAPARTAVAQGSEVGTSGVTMKSKKAWVDFSATPGVAGANEIHANTFTPSGAPLDVKELTVTIALPDQKIAPIDIPLRRLTPGHYFAPGFDVPINGDWRVTAKPLVSEFDQPTLRGTVTFG